MALLKRQAAQVKAHALPTLPDLQIIACRRPDVIGDVTGAVASADEKRSLIPPGKASAVVSVPGVAARLFARKNLDPNFQDRPAQPSPEALAGGRQPLPVGRHQHRL